MKLFKYILFLTSLLKLFSIDVHSQCCAAGNPSSLNSSIGLSGGKDILNVNLSHIYSQSDTYYNGISETNNKYSSSNFNFTYLNLTYGLSNKLRISTDLGYFVNKSQTFESSNYTRSTQGIADATIGFIYHTYQSDNKLFDIYQNARLTLPVGQFRQEFDGIVLPIDFQPSSGNYKYNIGLILSKRFEKSDFSLNSSISLEESKTIETESSFHKYGNLYNVSLAGVYNIMQNVAGLLQIRAEYREKALNAAKSNNNVYSFINASGGSLVYLSPQINYNFNGDWFCSLQYSIPIYKNVNGEQLTNKYYLTANISKSFDFSNNEKNINILSENINLSEIEFQISGNCEMCKERIENAINENNNVVKSDWDTESKIVKIYYNNEINIDEIKKSIANIGHDTDKFKADINIYNKLPECCLYRDNK